MFWPVLFWPQTFSLSDVIYVYCHKSASVCLYVVYLLYQNIVIGALTLSVEQKQWHLSSKIYDSEIQEVIWLNPC